MKGAIAMCMKNLVIDTFGKDKWIEVYKEMGYDFDPVYTLISNNSDDEDIKLMKTISKQCSLTMLQVADAFGEYWVTTFAPKYYSSYMQGFKNAKEMLLGMDNVHNQVTRNIENAKPPRFQYEWKNDQTLIMSYNSHRDLFPLFKSLVKGVAKYFNEQISIKDLGDNKLEIVFS